MALPLTRDQQRERIRAQLTKELLGAPTKKRKNKLHSAIQKPNGKAKFLANPRKHKDPKEKDSW